MNALSALDILKHPQNNDPSDISQATEYAIKELKKQIPEKPYCYDNFYATCPNCGKDDFEYDINDWGCNYCPDCGQALDWSEEE